MSSTASQSSGFMRIKSPSRVIPALLTRMPGISLTASRLPSKASTEAASATSSTAPRPAVTALPSQAVMASAPAGVVAVPMTWAPALANASAMARPMPREAPVTSAV